MSFYVTAKEETRRDKRHTHTTVSLARGVATRAQRKIDDGRRTERTITATGVPVTIATADRRYLVLSRETRVTRGGQRINIEVN